MLFKVKEIDRKFYEERLQAFLPDKIIDIHTHVWLEHFEDKKADEPVRTVTWPRLVANDNSIEDLLETYELLFPDKEVVPLIFSTPGVGDNLQTANTYISVCSCKHNLPSLILAKPQWQGRELEEKIVAGGFLGAKVYLTFAPGHIPQKEIGIFDFLPHHQLEILDKHNWIVMLHIPRDKRLRDSANLTEILEIERNYPRVKLIVAHVGRAYCYEDVGNAFEVLTETKNIIFDISANTNAKVFEELIKAVGAKRIIFGSDMPITRMRMRRICEEGVYINLVAKGMYGDVSGDKNMREVEGKEAEKLTFFMYEEVDALRRASESTGLTPDDIKDIFYNNAHRIIQSAKTKES